MNLKNMLEQKGIQPQEIRWDLTPKTAHISGIVASQEDWNRLEKEAEARVGYYFFISVWDCQASLMLMKNEKYSATPVCEVKEIPNRMLLKAIEEVGMINMSGNYPINGNGEIEAWLKKKLS
jgi:hypothetical protein